MSRQTTHPLDAEETRIAAALARLGDASPPPALDARIRGQAHAAVTRKRPLRRSGGALAAVLALGVGIKVSMSPIPIQPGIVPDPSALQDQSSPAMVAPVPSTRASESNQSALEQPTIERAAADQPRLDKAQADQTRRAPASTPRAASAPPADASRPSEAKQPSSLRHEQRVEPASIPIAPARLASPPASQAAENTAEKAVRSTSALPQPFPDEPPQRAVQSAPPAESDITEARPLILEERAAPGRSEVAAPPPTAARSPRAATMRASPSPAPTADTEAPAAAGADPQPTSSKRQAFGTGGRGALGQTGSAAKSKEPPSDAIAADAKGELDARVELSALIELARKLARNGDADRLTQVLRRITLDYPQAELPDDIRALLEAERSPR